ncbi:uncharacterized protein LOC116268287 [Nymphaea colorata]|uniref:uncharacterized protein LOC116268287 n=1 Tax=Nymphaea colorata TaxID=210225 RepID=UPI00129E5CC3|nr:uncharacterized protein LOC116268287 [Nymphaea colorata]
MEHILNATLAGGVVIGATAGIIYHPGGSLAIGFSPIGLYDTCGVHNLHAMPGLIGGLVSAVVAASFAYGSATDAYPITATDFPALSALVSAPYKQGGLQVAATFTSIGIGIATALIGGIFLRFVYSFNVREFFTDAVYFEEAEEFIEELALHNKTSSLEYAKVNDKTQGAELNMSNTQEFLKPTI